MLEGLPDAYELGKYLGTVGMAALMGLLGLLARQFHLVQKAKRKRKRDDDEDSDSGEIVYFDPQQTLPMGQYRAERHTHALIGRAREELLTVIKSVREVVDKVEKELRAHVEDSNEGFARLAVVESRVDGMEQTMKEVREDRIRERQEILDSIGAMHTSLDNLQNITLRSMGQREGDPFGRSRTPKG